MLDKDKFDENLGFVARHYREGAFNESRAWRSMKLQVRPWWRRGGSVAAAVVGVALMASACLYTWIIPDHSNESIETPVCVKSATASQKVTTARLEFTNEPLTGVIKELERIYGVKVTNIPEEDYRVTLSYEGDAADLIATINDLFGLHLELQQ